VKVRVRYRGVPIGHCFCLVFLVTPGRVDVICGKGAPVLGFFTFIGAWRLPVPGARMGVGFWVVSVGEAYGSDRRLLRGAFN